MHETSIRNFVLITIILSLSGCFGKKALNCAAINWNHKGLEDGKQGLDETKFLELKSKCEEQGVEASVVDYKEGWLLGIALYCEPANAFKLGKEGAKGLEKMNNCPVEFKTRFAESYNKGKELKKINDELGPAKKKLNNLKNDKLDLQKKLNKTKSEISTVDSKIFELSQAKENLEREAL